MRVEIICKTCGKIFKVIFSRKNTAMYCSNECFNKIQTKKIERVCLNCGKKFNLSPSKLKRGGGNYCSKKCFYKTLIGKPTWNKGKKIPKLSGKNNPQWKGGKIISSKGYIFILDRAHPKADKNGYISQARFVMEKIIGRFLLYSECVHHKGTHFSIHSIENKQDNSPENLQLFKNKSKHMKFHHLFNRLLKLKTFGD